MKKLHLVLSVVFTVVVTFSFNSCRPKEQSCDCCKSFKGSTTKTLLDSAGVLVTLKIPSAFTPNNIPFCDSNVVYDNGILSGYGCRKNIDSIYNDTLNSAFKIIGIEHFKGNELIIKTAGDTTKIDKFINYQLPKKVGQSERVFTGINIDTTLSGTERQRQMASGRYQFILQLYSSRYVHDKTTRIDSIAGFFCIIRNKAFCNRDCEGADAGDKLIK